MFFTVGCVKPCGCLGKEKRKRELQGLLQYDLDDKLSSVTQSKLSQWIRTFPLMAICISGNSIPFAGL